MSGFCLRIRPLYPPSARIPFPTPFPLGEKFTDVANMPIFRPHNSESGGKENKLPDKSAKATQPKEFAIREPTRVLVFLTKDFSFYFACGAWGSSIGHLKLTLRFELWFRETSAVKFAGEQTFFHVFFVKLVEICPIELATVKSTNLSLCRDPRVARASHTLVYIFTIAVAAILDLSSESTGQRSSNECTLYMQ